MTCHSGGGGGGNGAPSGSACAPSGRGAIGSTGLVVGAVTGFAVRAVTGLAGGVTAGFGATGPADCAVAERSGMAATAVNIAKRFQRAFITITYPSQTHWRSRANVVPSLAAPSLHRMNRREQGVDARFTAQFGQCQPILKQLGSIRYRIVWLHREGAKCLRGSSFTGT